MRINGLNQQEGAALLSVTARTLRDWADAPRNADGSYNGPALVKFYVAKLTTGGEFDNQRERLAAAQAEKVEMENTIRRGQLADIAEVERAWSDFVSSVRARILGIGSKLGPQLVNIADAVIIATAIRTEARTILAELAEYTPPHDGAEGGDSAGGETVAAPARINGKPVGGPGAATQQRKRRGTGTVADG